LFELTVPVSAADHSVGSADALVTVVEYGDFECPNRQQAAPAVDLLLQRFAGRVRFVYRHYPVVEVHRNAMRAAEAAECAAAQGRFWDMHRTLFDHHPRFSVPELQRYAQTLELDMDRFTSQLNSNAHVGLIRQRMTSGRESGVRGAPGFFVNGKIHDGSFGLHSLLDAADAALRG
jgi:protein-disulfide isomerase